jgi:formate/nitrite transporter FocA (FNT family)
VSDPGFAFEQAVDEGERRLSRTWMSLLATGVVGGAEVSIGVFALLLVHEQTNNELLSALAFTLGFIALTLGASELFTENFLIPIATVVAGKASPVSVLRLWFGTCVTNLIGGWLLMGLVMTGLPKLHEAAVTVAVHYPQIGIGWRSFCTAVLGGSIITFMTWMQHGTTSVPAKIVAAMLAAFLLAAGALDHVIVVSVEMFAALIGGAPFGYLDWLTVAAWAALGNIVGGVGFVTLLRLAQVGPEKIRKERQRPKGQEREHPAEES